MSLPTRMGLSLPVFQDLHKTVEMAKWGEDNGYEGLWIADSGDLDALTVSAVLATHTERVRIGTAVVPVYPRTPAGLASITTTISQLAPGRFILGLGSSSHLMIDGWHGIPFEKPLSRVKETTQVLRGMLNGEKVSFTGGTLRSKGYRLAPPLQAPVPIYLAALLPRMLEMAGEFGDGVVLNLFPLSALPKMMEHIAIGAQRAGKKMEDLEIVCRHQVWVTGDPAAARALVRKRFAPYYATPVYNKFLAWFGYPDKAQTLTEGWREKDRDKTEGALDDELVEQIAVIGDADKCREEIRAFVAAGITTPVIACIAPDPQEYRDTVEAFLPDKF